MSQSAPEDIYVLSPMQQGLLFHSLYAPDERLYVDQLILPLAVGPEPELMAAAWRQVVARHPALRTSFHWQGLDKPLQAVHSEVPVPYAVHDLAGRNGRPTAQLLEEIRRNGFDLARPPLLRLDWIASGDPGDAGDAGGGGIVGSQGDGGGVLAWTYHHILLDAWSANVVLGEVITVYQALATGGQAALPPVRRYADYIAWLRRRDAAGDPLFWRERLAGFRTPTPLWMERRGGDTAGGEGDGPPSASPHGEKELRLDPAATAALAAFARRHQLTLNTLVQGAWAALLHRTSGQDDILFGAIVAGRPEELPGIESMVGLFINTLPIRTRWDAAADPAAWLRRVQAWQLAVSAHAYTPLAEIQRCSELPAGRSLFESILVFENIPGMGPRPAAAAPPAAVPAAGAAPASIGGVVAPAATGGPGRSGPHPSVRYVSRTHYPLSLLVVPDEWLTLRATFDRRRLDAAGVAHHLELMAALLRGIAGLAAATDPAAAMAALGDLPLLPEAERHQLLCEWQDPGGAAPGQAGRLLHQGIAERARIAPHDLAVLEADTGVSLTYGELARRTARQAARLRGLGVGPETPVVVAVERSAAAIVALLAVLEADGVCVPVEPGTPEPRLAFVIGDTGARVVLRDDDLTDPADPTHPATSPDPATPAAGPRSPSRAHPDNLAYVIYTSGSTGEPKGVAVSHRQAALHFAAVTAEYGIAPGERVLQFASLAFDAGLEQVFTALLAGATLVLRGPAVWDTAGLTDRLTRLRVQVANLPTAYWIAWTEALHGAAAGHAAGHAATGHAATGRQDRAAIGYAGAPTAGDRTGGGGEAAAPPLRLLIAGGEAMPAAAAAAWQRSPLAGARLLNAYGPTEALVTATLYAPQPGEAAAPPLGRALAGRAAYVLDRGLAPVPAGVAGELCLGGRLARGYLGRPRLTAAAFVPDGLSGAAGARLYRTGDRVRHLPDGRIAYLGRIDRQLKVRGFRVEPGEIEAALARHPSVAEAVVLPHTGAQGTVLVAFVVPRPAAPAPTAAELDGFLRQRLPAAWVPAAFSLLARPARTAGGKLDRRALPDWDAAGGLAAPRHGAAGSSAREAPRNAVEGLLADLWSAVLALPAVGVHDDFLAAGGHSLLAMRLLSRVREAFGVELPLAGLFAEPTVAGQARQVLAALAARDAGPGSGAPSTDGNTGAAGPDGTSSTAGADGSSRAAGGGAGPAARPAPPLVPAPRDIPLPLSFAQQRLWILDQFDPGMPAYNIPVALRLTGALSAEAMAAALTALAARHEPLRTSFQVMDGQPVQRIAAAGPVPLPRVDLGGLAPARRDALLAALARHEAVRRFALGRGPLLRAVLVRLGDADHGLFLTVHHIVADAWSLGILLSELAELYGAGALGRPAALPSLPVQYADFALWQRACLEGAELERQLAFWRARLDRLPGALPLPLDRPRPPVQTFRGARRPVPLAGAAAAGARQLAAGERATLFMTLLAAWAELLARYSGRTDLAIGTPVANRSRLETEGLIGFFVDTLVLRLDLAGAPTVRQLVARTRAATIDATVHQDVPFEKLVEELRPERSLALTPFFQVMFTLDSPPPPPRLAGLDVDPIAVESGTAKFDLTLALAAAGRSLDGALEYNADLFDPATAARLAAHFANLVAAFAANPERPAASLPLLAAGELHQIQVEWNDTAPAGAGRSAATLDRRFALQAAATPQATALTAGGESLTYGDLDRHATLLARRLAAAGVGPEVTAAVFLERTPELVVALLAVLKAGGAYVPLDPAYPSERLAATIEDCGAAVVLTQEWLADRLPPSPARQLLVGALYDDADAVDAGSDEAPAGGAMPAPSPDNIAYLIYTSGSTGRPKGVAIAHRAACALLDWAHDRFAPAELATVFASTSVCFDLSVFEIFAPLTAGGRVHLATSGLDLLALDESDRVTLVNTVPSLLAEVAPRGLPATVRTLNLAGEPIPVALAERLGELPDLERAWNLYGPSEVTTYATAGAIAAADLAAGRQPPIGRPITGTTAHLLDGELRAAPIGAAGELYLGGSGLARGYHRRPELTAAAFVPNPLGAPGARLYRTGDLARALGDGRLEFLGRADAQVKVRGFRIEPGEIEAALARHPDVARAVVVPRPDGAAAAGGRRLVAYLVPPAGRRAAAADELRDFLRRTLPDFMIPAAFVELPALPVLPNGKIDRAALPNPETARRTAAGAQAPRTDLERTIATVVAEVLGVEHLVVDENFFDLGGHSLTMIRAAGILEQRLGRALPVLELFRFPTVAALAAHLGGGEPAAPPQPAAGEPALELAGGRQPARRRRREMRGELDRSAPLDPEGR